MKTNWGTGINMTPRARRSAIISFIICFALPAWGQQYLLYTPQPASSGQKVPPQEGVLVQEIEVQKGDTLYDLSRKYSGHGMYFPQILLFNSIKNPNLIYPGKNLRIPVSSNETLSSGHSDVTPASATHKSKKSSDRKPLLKSESLSPVNQSGTTLPASAPSTELSLSDLKSVGAGKSKTNRKQKKPPVIAKKKPSSDAPASTPSLSTLPAAHKSAVSTIQPSGQKLFEAAVKAYRQDDCRTALDLLDRYLADNSSSPLAADANLYKAECYLKMSAQ
jgi:LysM repeat protein